MGNIRGQEQQKKTIVGEKQEVRGRFLFMRVRSPTCFSVSKKKKA